MLTLKINWYKLLIAIALITAIAVCTFRACNRDQPAFTTSAVGKVIPKQIPITYKGKSGTVHTETKVVQAEHDVWLEDYYKSLLAEVKEELAIKDKQLRDVIAASITNEGYVKIPLTPDTPNVINALANLHPCEERPEYFKYKDRFITLAGRIEHDSIDLAYRVEDSVHLVTYWKRKNFLSAKELFVNGFSTNPNSTIKGLQMVKLNQATPKKWAVGIQAGYFFDGSSFKPGVGIGITKTIFRF